MTQKKLTVIRSLPAAFLFSVLSACGGGGTSENRNPPSIDPPKFTTQSANSFESEIAETIRKNPNAVPDRPTGTATYAGPFRIGTTQSGDSDFNQSLLGGIALNVNFDGVTDPISGTAGNFTDLRNGDQMQGELVVSEGDVTASRGTSALSFELSGSLRNTRTDKGLNYVAQVQGDIGGPDNFAMELDVLRGQATDGVDTNGVFGGGLVRKP